MAQNSEIGRSKLWYFGHLGYFFYCMRSKLSYVYDNYSTPGIIVVVGLLPRFARLRGSKTASFRQTKTNCKRGNVELFFEI